jgi:hypothetical protein
MYFGMAVGAQHLGWREKIPVQPVPGHPDQGFDLPTVAGQLGDKMDGRT